MTNANLNKMFNVEPSKISDEVYRYFDADIEALAESKIPYMTFYIAKDNSLQVRGNIVDKNKVLLFLKMTENILLKTNLTEG